jgi:hypothetical protein
MNCLFTDCNVFYMASISRHRWYIAGIRIGFTGIVVAVFSIFLPG